jgi:3',5'-cyclic AMP phosphodiesterase CpdA
VRIVHLSDLHFGWHNPAIAAGLAEEVAGQSPDIIVVSGDFTQIGSPAEFAMAGDFLRTLSAPVFAVPGNHDVPTVNLYMRFVHPFARYRRHIAGDIEPLLETNSVVLAGINTARRMKLGLNWAEGAISREQLKRLKRRFAAANPDATRIVVAHHPLLQPEVAVSMKTVKRADLALATFRELGVRLVLSGHFHLSYVRRHNPGEIASDIPPGPRQAAAGEIVVVQASTAISTRLRQHPNSYNVIELDAETISIFVREWDGEAWYTREEFGPVAEPIIQKRISKRRI